jgi:hypothetical protein
LGDREQKRFNAEVGERHGGHRERKRERGKERKKERKKEREKERI